MLPYDTSVHTSIALLVWTAVFLAFGFPTLSIWGDIVDEVNGKNEGGRHFELWGFWSIFKFWELISLHRRFYPESKLRLRLLLWHLAAFAWMCTFGLVIPK